MQDYEFMYEVCLCSVLEDRSHMETLCETLFTGFKLKGRGREAVWVMFGMVAYLTYRGITERKPGITGFQNWLANLIKTEINNQVGFLFGLKCTTYDT